MAERTFLVKVDIVETSPGAVLAVASRLFDELEQSGFPVLEVEPWSAPATEPSSLGSIPGVVESKPPNQTINPV